MSSPNNRLKELRKERKKSGIAVAKELGITPQYYYDIEKGERRLTAEIAGKLTEILHTTVDYLIGVTDVNQYEEVGEDAKAPISMRSQSLRISLSNA